MPDYRVSVTGLHPFSVECSESGYGTLAWSELMAQELILFLILAAIVWLWLDSARAREIATELAQVMCQRKGVQFLDGTVALRRLRLCDSGNGKRISRVFNFDYSDESGQRYQGNIQTCGRDVTDVSLGLYVKE